ncbi:trans-sulfuration enzyme family protein [Ornithinimicrobium faecis]|uniref:PLP-dependent aspartate aminotransferase family protein n=1 Tax=Ornithinimicrobium faecis TaxID=2934158 RepID=A0ABY4YSP0_9MICO|nr:MULTISPECIES: PLP-dependent aspartate aminotransferase family protein [unclassified Ornithinimicrobium]USQ79611.1 PLP-dependent aspartate aminotransferase family protein [Ornithinimicrobium sp. HY1793]
MSFDTEAVHAAREDLTALGVHVPPIDLSTTYPVGDVETGGASYENLATGGTPTPGDSLVYQRLWNPTVARFEEALARLEGAQEAVAFGSGMAALSATLLATVAAGKPHVVAVRPLYGGSDHVLATGLLGTRVTWAEPDGIAAAIESDTGLVIVETPANPTLDLVDLSAVAAQAGDVPVVVDNTFATPVLQRPVEHGATIVLHSATKFLGGHGDIMAGAIATTSEWASRIRGVRALTGGVLHPVAAYQLHRGLQTLPTRVRAQQDNAQVVAHWLGKQDGVTRVFHPSIKGCDPAGLVGRQMSGCGAVLAFEVTSFEAASTVAQSCGLITHAVSLGGVDSLIQHPASLTHRPVAPEARPAASVLRLSVGLEDPADIIADLRRALQAARDVATESSDSRVPTESSVSSVSTESRERVLQQS